MKKILVAEDNDSNYILMTYILKKYYTYDRAKNGQEATKKIKEAHPNLPVVALTANAFDSDRQLAFDAGCDDFLSKPVSSDACIQVIKKLVGE